MKPEIQGAISTPEKAPFFERNGAIFTLEMAL